MYISRLVKTRILHLGLLSNCHSVSLISLAAHFYLSSSPFHSSYLFPYLIFLVHLLPVYLSGSAVTPSHFQRGPSVAIPSVQRSQLSYLWLHPHFIVQVGQRLARHYKPHTDWMARMRAPIGLSAFTLMRSGEILLIWDPRIAEMSLD
jgi:hypothetical protein